MIGDQEFLTKTYQLPIQKKEAVMPNISAKDLDNLTSEVTISIAYEDYGKTGEALQSWRITADKMNKTNNAKFMHCLPVRRNVVVDDAVIDSKSSIVIEQANNRTYAAQLVLQKILKNK